MAKITIDGKEIDVAPGTTIIQAARDNGIHIPHFCWHPKLSPSGNCRMCLVEVEKMPKLAIACMTNVADGMVVRTSNERVITARNAVMEFLLINHPLDCPICDEAGECKLQDYSYKYSTGTSRFDEDKVHKPKRVELGPRIILDDERCIMCSRCVRFADEIAHQPVLTFTERGTHVVLRTFPHTVFDSPYSMNVVDICPVGALTNRDFRFKSRVWEMSSTDSICVGCARGCNTNVWVRNNEILRLTPRLNEEVNSYWMCDKGRLESFPRSTGTERIKAPMIRKEGVLVETGWDEATARVMSELKSYKKSEIAGLASARATLEDNYLFAKFMKEILGVTAIGAVPHIVEGDQDDLLIRADKTPNAAGVRALGIPFVGESAKAPDIFEGIKSGAIKALYVIEDNIAADPKIASVLPNLDLLIVQCCSQNETTALADIVLSASSFAEKHGTMVNFQGRVQRIRPALVTLEQERALDGYAASRWDKFAAQNDRWGKGSRRDARPSWRIVTSLASALGQKQKYASAEDVFRELAEKFPAFKGLTYSKIGTRGVMLKDLAPAASPLIV